MDESSPPSPTPEKPSPASSSHGGIEIRGGEVRAEHDIIGGDSISAQNVTVQEGYSAAQVQRLILIVGGLVFSTALCFFIFGAISAAAIVGALNAPQSRPPNIPAAENMQAKIDDLNSKPPGSEFNQTFTETEVNSYFHYILGPSVRVSNGKARFLDEPGEIALGGNLDDAGGLPFLAQINVTTDEHPVHLQGAWVKILPTPDGVNFGWIPVTPLASGFESRLNGLLFGKVQFSNVAVGQGSGLELGQNVLRLSGNTK